MTTVRSFLLHQTAKKRNCRTSRRMHTYLVSAQWLLTLASLTSLLIGPSQAVGSLRIITDYNGPNMTLFGHTGPVRSLRFIPTFNQLASGSDDATFKIWDLDTGVCIKTMEYAHEIANSIELVEYQNTLALGTPKGYITVWNYFTGFVRHSFYNHTDSVTALKLLSYNLLASGSRDFTIRLWDLTTNKLVRTLYSHSDWVTSLEMTPYNQLLSASYDRTIKLWDLSSSAPDFQCTRTLLGHIGAVRSLRLVSHDLVASGSDDKSIKIWRYATGECMKTLLGHTAAVTALEITLSNHQLISGSRDGTIKIWTLHKDNLVASGSCLRTINGHDAPVTALQLISQSQLVSASEDQTIKIWELNGKDSNFATKLLASSTHSVYMSCFAALIAVKSLFAF